MPNDLSTLLDNWAGRADLNKAVAETLKKIAHASIELAKQIAVPDENADQARIVGKNTDGDAQKFLDVEADHLFTEALKSAPVCLIGSEEAEDPVALNSNGLVAVAIDPLDGSSNIETNATVGTIFSILPISKFGKEATFGQVGDAQLAAGYIAYGPRTQLYLTLGEGTILLQLDIESGEYVVVNEKVEISNTTSEFAINTSNYRFWSDAIRTYVDDCFAGSEGVRERNFNMRWLASLVADASRIFARGGIFLYPGDIRPGYREGRLRLVYEAFPIAFLVEQAGGKASTGSVRILDLIPKQLHERIPLIFGSRNEVEHIEGLIADPSAVTDRSPLFGNSSLFRN
ncbi:class 1 fructose-bisphosphatase [Ahrensia sp. AH-315-G08]|nr:class 1 fructose-bisphosphatase [Ahrensia sp. AH-315-G08]